MNYKVTILGKSYELPARTLDVDDKIDAIVETDRAYQAAEITRREAVERLHGFVETLAPGSLHPLAEVDTNDIMKACLDIINAYNAPAQKARAEAQLAQVKDVLNRPEVQKMLKLAEAQAKK